MKKLLTILCIMFLLAGCNANDDSEPKKIYNIDLTGNKNGDKVYEMLTDCDDKYEKTSYEGGAALTKEATVEIDGNEYTCYYDISYNIDQNDPFISIWWNGGSISINLDNGDWDTYMIPCQEPNYSCMLIIDNKTNELIGYALGETHDGSTFFDFENLDLNKEKADIFKTVDWLNLANEMESIKKGDDTLFSKVLDADELTKLFNDMNAYLEEFEG